MRKGSSFYFGLFIIIIGVIGLLTKLEIIHFAWYDFWVLIIWALGLSFELAYFLGSEKEPGFLVPGGILLTIAFIFSVCMLYGWYNMAVLWPLFILAPAFGLFQLYIFGNREKELLIPVGILGIIGGTFLLSNFFTFQVLGIVIPVLLILFGLWLILSKQKV